MPMSTRPRRVRVQLDLGSDEAAALDDLRDGCGLRSRADAVRLSLAVLGWVVDQAASGRRVVALGRDDVAHFAIPGIQLDRFRREEVHHGRG
jgi:hypothetical protein